MPLQIKAVAVGIRAVSLFLVQVSRKQEGRLRQPTKHFATTQPEVYRKDFRVDDSAPNDGPQEPVLKNWVSTGDPEEASLVASLKVPSS